MAIAFLLLGAFLFYQSTRLSMRSLDGGPGPGLLPSAIGALMVLLAVLLLRSGWRERTQLGAVWRIGVMVGVVALYTAVLDRVGFVIATALMMIVLMVAFNERYRLPLAGLGVLGTALTYVLFFSVLKVPLPPDPWRLWR